LQGDLCAPSVNNLHNTHDYSAKLKATVCLIKAKLLLEQIESLFIFKNLWDGCLAESNINWFPFRGSVDFNLYAHIFLIRLNGDGYSQLYLRSPECIGNCANNFDNRAYCYARPGSLLLNFNLQVGFEFIFLRKWITVHTYSGDQATCSENPVYSATTLTSTTTSSSTSLSNFATSSTSLSTTSTEINTIQNGSEVTLTTDFASTTSATTINLCATNPCLNNGTCNNIQNAFLCSCVIGFTGLNCGIAGLKSV